MEIRGYAGKCTLTRQRDKRSIILVQKIILKIYKKIYAEEN